MTSTPRVVGADAPTEDRESYTCSCGRAWEGHHNPHAITCVDHWRPRAERAEAALAKLQDEYDAYRDNDDSDIGRVVRLYDGAEAKLAKARRFVSQERELAVQSGVPADDKRMRMLLVLTRLLVDEEDT